MDSILGAGANDALKQAVMQNQLGQAPATAQQTPASGGFSDLPQPSQQSVSPTPQQAVAQSTQLLNPSAGATKPDFNEIEHILKSLTGRLDAHTKHAQGSMDMLRTLLGAS